METPAALKDMMYESGIATTTGGREEDYYPAFLLSLARNYEGRRNIEMDIYEGSMLNTVRSKTSSSTSNSKKSIARIAVLALGVGVALYACMWVDRWIDSRARHAIFEQYYDHTITEEQMWSALEEVGI